MSTRRIGVGIIGAGIMGAGHAASVVADSRADVVAVASLPLEGAEELGTRYGAALATDDYIELLEDPNVDLVCIATPDYLHTEIAVAAAQAGKSFIVEKPLATSLADADAIIAAVNMSSGIKAMTSFNHRWIPSYARAHEEIIAGNVGKPRLAYARKNDRIYVPTEMIRWASKTTPAWFLSSHDIDLVCWYFDASAVEVFATAVNGVLKDRGIDTPDAIQAQVRFDNGAVATFESCWIYPNTFPTMTDSFIEVVGTDGTIHLDRKDDQLEVASAKNFEFPRTSIMPFLHGRPGGALFFAVSHMIDCILEDSSPLVTLESSRHVTAILDAAHRSVAIGKAQSVML